MNRVSPAWRKRVLGLALVGAILATAQAFASAFIGVAVPGAAGSSTRTGFVGQIDAESVSWGFKNSGSPALAPIVVTKRLDAATPKLIDLGASGKLLPTVTINHVTFVGGDGSTPVAQTTVLTNAKVTDFQMMDSADGGAPVESVTFTAQSVTFSYVTVSASGALNKPSVASVPAK